MKASWIYESTIRKKRLLALLLLFATPSCSTCGPSWQGQQVQGTTPSFGSARLILPPANEFSGLELEFMQSSEGLKLYLNVYGLEIPPDGNESDTSRVYISFRDHSYTFSARRFLGGQRLLIPQYVQEEIICYLQENQPVFIQVGRYQADIFPAKFMDLFRKMIGAP